MTGGMGVERRTEDRAVIDAATEGPWMVTPDHPEIVMKPDAGHPDGWDGTIIARVPADEFGLVESDNSAFIAAARTRWPAALDALDRVEALHQPETFGGEMVCLSCLRYTSPLPGRVPWPCATVRAIRGDAS